MWTLDYVPSLMNLKKKTVWYQNVVFVTHVKGILQAYLLFAIKILDKSSDTKFVEFVTDFN